MKLQDKVCLITGGAKGIGSETAKLFHEEGGIVEIADIDTENGQKLENQLSSGSERICFSKIDITNPYEVKKWVDDIIERHGHIDVLFNNAGISAVGLLHEIDESIWEKVFSVNVTGSYLTSKNILPIMMKQNYGSIINMSSCVAEMGLAERSVYGATKGALLSMTKSMQVDYAPYNIRINALMPGTIYTPFVEDYLKTSYSDPEKAIEGLKKRQLGSELGTPKDVANAALFLASDENQYVMGTGLKVDGGVTAGKFY